MPTKRQIICSTMTRRRFSTQMTNITSYRNVNGSNIQLAPSLLFLAAFSVEGRNNFYIFLLKTNNCIVSTNFQPKK